MITKRQSVALRFRTVDGVRNQYADSDCRTPSAPPGLH